MLIRTLTSVRMRWHGWRFRHFEESIHPATWAEHDRIIAWAERQVNAEAGPPASSVAPVETDDLVVRQGDELRRQTLEHFRGKLESRQSPRILVHVPEARHSPGGFSLFSNLVQALNFIGIPARVLPFNSDTGHHLDEFSPTVLLTSDHESYLSHIDWTKVAHFRYENPLQVGLTASLQEYGNTPLKDRLAWALRHDVDFYYSFRAPEYLRIRREYQPFYDEGFKILSVEFGANVLKYYPVYGVARDLAYVFLASSNPDKWQRYSKYLGRVFRKYSGLIDGPGWSRTPHFVFNQDRDRYVYARAHVGINLHIDNQIEWPSELNERTYMLAACGVPQLVDHPKLLLSRFSSDGLFVASSPREYEQLFAHILAHPDEAERRALVAQREVFSSHTSFHRAESFVNDLVHSEG